MKENQAFITVKDHKDRFPHRVLCRSLNTSKTNIGKISKVLLDKTNSAVFSSIKINQWKNTSLIITWFEKITHKQTSSFICFDVENFYLLPPVFYSKNRLNLQDSSSRFLMTIMQARKTLLFEGTTHWIKMGGDEDFDIPMDCFDGAETFELVGT